MITRDLAGVDVVTAFDIKTFYSCTVSGFTCTCSAGSTVGALPNSYAGRIIDRLALGRSYRAVVIAPVAHGPVITCVESTAHLAYLALSVGLQHACTTGESGFVDFSTEDWPAEQPLQVVTTATSTGASYFSASAKEFSDNAAAIMTTALTSSTSTAYAALATSNIKAIDITDAKRYLRVLIQPRIESTGCAGPNMNVSASLVFGIPDEAPGIAPRGRVFVTSACSS
jgi:hypothetical protein